MLVSNVSYARYENYEAWHRNYAVMSFYLQDAEIENRKFSFVGGAVRDGLSHSNFLYSPVTIDRYMKKGASIDGRNGRDYSLLFCPICGKKLKTVAMPSNRDNHGIVKSFNTHYCEDQKCEDIVDFFGRKATTGKRKYRLKKVADTCHITTKQADKYIFGFEFDEIKSTAILSVFLSCNKSNKGAFNSSMLTMYEAEKMLDLNEADGVMAGVIGNASIRGTLYGVKFPSRVGGEYKDYIPKKGFEEWLSNDIVQKKLAEKRTAKINY